MKRLWILLALVLVGGSWFMFAKSAERIGELETRIERLEEAGDPDEEVPALRSEIQSLEGARTFNGILLVIFSAVLLGALFVVFVLPAWAGRVAEGVYGSTAELDDTAGREARSLLAKGDFHGAMEAFRKWAAESGDRVPWMEIAKIQRQHLEDPRSAVATLYEALAAKDWPEDDEAFFLFRVADILNEDAGEREQAVAVLQRVIREFPEGRHAMNAKHRLREWGVG